ncbi:MAG: class I SAM-dependent methyltransferase [bacterium]|nr:class I SAM-dependent methyltransferase [bacterium]
MSNLEKKLDTKQNIESTARINSIALYVPEKSTSELLDGVEVTVYGKNGFEYKNPLFWFVYDRIVGKCLENVVERKTRNILGKYLSADEKKTLVHLDTRTTTLGPYRRNFGLKQDWAEIFLLETTLFNRGSPVMKHLCENVANAPGLDDVYNNNGGFAWNGLKIFPLSGEPDLLSNIYMDKPEAQGTRNRYYMLLRLYDQFGGGKTLSIACGSAQPLIHAVNRFVSEKHYNLDNTTLVLTDQDARSLDLARLRAKQANIEDRVQFVQSSYLELGDALGNEKFDIVEACGIADYLPDKYFKSLVEKAMSYLNVGGKLLISNMMPGVWSSFIRRTYNWEMIYRTTHQVAELLKESGQKDIRIYVEPWKVHMIAVVTKH